ncbi:MAG: 2-oxoglutarate dehydrogenase, E2 component, dihydrolipoamide succinyltransferase [Actinomycetaceae bacterium]|nr:2-oxoglutarate dehydrogenase, E2 component, dihydrolipoamide succinyltransferase [Actinomycetaceae bacterium]
MSQSVKMPALGESVTEGTVSRWLKSVGDTVEADEPLLEVSTDKVDSEVPAPCAGTITKILVEEDETVDVGANLCIIGDASEAEAPVADSQPVHEQAPVEHHEEAGVSEGMENQLAQPAPAPSSGDNGGEATDVMMPALGESVTEGTVSSWLKSVGDHVEADEPLVEVATDKVDSEVPSPVSGVLSEILVQEDETVEVGTVLARIGGSGGNTSQSQQQAAPEPADDSDDDVPGANIPSSVTKEGDKKVVQWAYPQADSGYPGTMKPEGQHIPAAPKIPSAPVAPQSQPSPHTPPPPVPGAPTAPAVPTPPVSAAPSQPQASAPSAPVSSGEAEAKGTYVTPLVRKLAKDKGVDLSQVKGTGVAGRIRKQDVLDAAAKKAKAPAQAAAPTAPATAPAVSTDSTLRGKTEKMSRLRQTIAKRMMDSLQTSAQLTTVIEVDVTRIASLRARAKNDFLAREGTKLTYLPFFVKAATEALKAHPKLNATIGNNEVTYHDHEHIGIAVDAPRGLMVPVIRDCGDLTIAGIAKHINDLAARTRAQKVTPDELSGSTFTITNTGSGGALFDTPIINMPEVAILGVGTIVKRPMVIKDADGNDTIAVRSMVYLALSYDHQLVDGADAARYLMTVKKRLEDGDFEAELGL